MNFKTFTYSLLFLSTGLFAQTGDTNLPSENVSVVKAYEPVLAESEKINFNPSKLEEAAKAEPVFDDYYTPTRFMQLSFDPPTIKPLGMKKEKREYIERFWVKAGFGNMKTPLIDISANTREGNALMMGANIRHIQSDGPDIDLQEIQKTEASIFGEWGNTQYKIDGTLSYQRDAYNNYDTQFLFPEFIAEIEDTFHRTNHLVELDLGFRNNRLNDFNEFEYDFTLKPYLFFTENDETEKGVAMTSSFFKAFDNGLKPGVEVEFYFDDLSHTLLFTNVQNTLINLTPKVKWSKPLIDVSLGANIVKASYSSLRVRPDVYLEINPIEKHLNIFGSWNTKGQNISYHSLLEDNPFTQTTDFVDRDHITYQRVRDVVTESRVIGLKGNYGKKFHGSVQVGQFISENHPLFLPSVGTRYMFEADYEEELTRESLKIGLNYLFDKKSLVGVETAFHRYETVRHESAWYLPEMELKFYGAYTFIEKLRITADFNLYNGLAYKNPIPAAGNGTIDDQYDLNVGATYEILENLSIFLDVYNLTNNEYERYLNHPVLGTRAIGGVVARF